MKNPYIPDILFEEGKAVVPRDDPYFSFDQVADHLKTRPDILFEETKVRSIPGGTAPFLIPSVYYDKDKPIELKQLVPRRKPLPQVCQRQKDSSCLRSQKYQGYPSCVKPTLYHMLLHETKACLRILSRLLSGDLNTGIVFDINYCNGYGLFLLDLGEWDNMGTVEVRGLSQWGVDYIPSGPLRVHRSELVISANVLAYYMEMRGDRRGLPQIDKDKNDASEAGRLLQSRQKDPAKESVANEAVEWICKEIDGDFKEIRDKKTPYKKLTINHPQFWRDFLQYKGIPGDDAVKRMVFEQVREEIAKRGFSFWSIGSKGKKASVRILIE